MSRASQTIPPPSPSSQLATLESDSSTSSRISSERSLNQKRTKKKRQKGQHHHYRRGTRDETRQPISALSDSSNDKSGEEWSVTPLLYPHPPYHGTTSSGSLLSADQLQQTPQLWYSPLIADSWFGGSPSFHQTGATPQDTSTPCVSASMLYESQSEGLRSRSVYSSQGSGGSSSAIL